MIRVVLLDAGNTLFRERRSRGQLYAEVIERILGQPSDPAQLDRAIAHVHDSLPRVIDGQYRYTRGWFETFIQRTLAERGLRSTPSLAAGLFEVFDDPATFRVFDDVPAALHELRGRGLRLAVVSNWAPHLPRILEGLGLRNAFEELSVSATEGCEKPAAELFERTLSRLGVGADEAVHVGDRLDNDVEGALSAGIEGVLLQRSGARESAATSPPPPRISSLMELPGWIDRRS